MKILIVEEALKNHSGHWYEYNRAIIEEARSRGIEVTVLAHQDIEEDVKSELKANAFFPVTSWDQVYYDPRAWKRYLGILKHNLSISQLLTKHFRQTEEQYDIVLVPTVVLFHWLAWRWLVFRGSGKWFKRVVLTTRNNAGEYDPESKSYQFSGSAKILKLILQTFAKPVEKGVVQFASDSHKLGAQYKDLCGLPVTTYPHPRDNLSFPAQTDRQQGGLTFSALGPPRYEKGSDLVLRAMESILKDPRGFNGQFVLHWTEPVFTPEGEKIDAPEEWDDHPQVKLIRGRLSSEEYEAYLEASDVLLLPYRRAQYHARLSGVAIEAFQSGGSCVCVSDTWVEECMVDIGTGIALATESVTELTEVIRGYSEPAPSKQRIQKALKTHSSASFVDALIGEWSV